MKNNKTQSKSVSYAKWGYVFILPFFLVYFVFTFYPQVLTIYNSFFENYRDGLTQVGPNFVGLDNYKALLTPSNEGTIDIIKYFGNTIIMWIMGAVPQFVFALLLAVFFTNTRLNIKGQRIMKTVIYLPNLIMASAFSMLFYTLFSNVGPIKPLLVHMGILDKSFDFFFVTLSVRSLVALLNFLMWFGNTTILLMAGIQSIDESLFESARIDGASSTRVFFNITMPLLKPIFIYTFITSMIGGLQMFDVPTVLTNAKGTPDRTVMTVIMYLNNYLGGSNNYGMAGAISVILFIVTGILSLIVFKTLDRDRD
ncbi:MAG: sugar ABC transporter permease [Lachnospiraceae bacterium]|jgi:multiple sugar transport system permease protein|nr:sugar ABC transporter permease [Lachnospiraceae bacterium]